MSGGQGARRRSRISGAPGASRPRVAPAAGVRGRLRTVRQARENHNDRGQAAVEFVGTLPIILVTVGLLWQAALTGYTFALAGNAADEAARAGAVGGADACAAAARRTLSGAWQGVNTQCRVDGEMYRATVELRVPALFPGGIDLPITVPGEAAAPNEERTR